MEAAEYDRMQAVEDDMWWYRAAHARVLDALAQAPGPRGAALLDAGCGTGGLLRRLARLRDGDRDDDRDARSEGGSAGPARESIPRLTIGLDASAEAAASARRRSGQPLLVGTANALPFPDASLGTILSIDVLCHRLVDPARALAEAHRCLLPGGTLVLNLPAFEWLASYHDARVHNARRFDRPGLRRLIDAAGFASARIDYWNSLLFPLMVLRRKLFTGGGGESDVADYPVLVDRLFAGLLALERAGMRAGLRYPFGGSLIAIARKQPTECR